MKQSSDDLLASIAHELQSVPSAAADAALLAPVAMPNNARIVDGARRLLRMEDHPGSFDPWCRAFASQSRS